MDVFSVLLFYILTWLRIFLVEIKFGIKEQMDT